MREGGGRGGFGARCSKRKWKGLRGAGRGRRRNGGPWHAACPVTRTQQRRVGRDEHAGLKWTSSRWVYQLWRPLRFHAGRPYSTSRLASADRSRHSPSAASTALALAAFFHSRHVTHDQCLLGLVLYKGTVGLVVIILSSRPSSDSDFILQKK